MIELERNSSIDAVTLSEFFARCGWEEPDAAVKLAWALAASDEWVVCKLDGEMIGFGRACRLSSVRRIVFDLVVDPRFRGIGLRAQIARLLTETAGGLEEVSVFSESWAAPLGYLPVATGDARPGTLPAVSAKVYLGKGPVASGGEE
jgi:GNAT superfamily N-acetyltransferase